MKEKKSIRKKYTFLYNKADINYIHENHRQEKEKSWKSKEKPLK